MPSKEKYKETRDLEFDFTELKLKDAVWTVKLSLKRRLSQIMGQYELLMYLNKQPFERNIENAEKELNKVKAGNLTIDGSHKKRIAQAEDDLKAQSEALDNAITEYEDIRMECLVEKVEYKSGRTNLTLIIRSEDVHAFDDHKFDLMPGDEQDNMYLLELIPN